MTVKELIEELKTHSPEAIVIAPTSNFEKGQSDTDIQLYAVKVKRISERFTDAFDHESYTASVYRTDSKGMAAVRIYGS